MRLFKLYATLILIIGFSNLKAQEVNLEDFSPTEEFITIQSNNYNKQDKKSPSKLKTYFSATQVIQAKKSLFFQNNIGVGFLYFSGIRGNLMGKPVLNFAPIVLWRDVPFKGRLSYNHTPLFEFLIGYRINNLIKIALSYQHQAGITIQTKALRANPVTESSYGSNMAQLISNLSLDALLAKLYFELPYSLIFKKLTTSPYFAVGVGPGWQTWNRVQINYMEGNDEYAGHPLPLRQKISANAVWMIDIGMRIQSAYPNSKFSVLIGSKYNQWGQARSIGKMTQQGAHKLALGHPLIIKTVYQFAPYLGVQWNFPNSCSSQPSYTLNGKNPNVWRPYWVAARNFQCPKAIWTQFNAGIGFLYFSGIRGNLMGKPVINFNPASSWRDVPFKGRLSYNRTPLFEFLLGYRINNSIKIALSYQHQAGITIQSKALLAFPNIGGGQDGDTEVA